ncbi:MAG: DUF86 domain-containing protein [Candidatus Hydrogenedentes bacterium]|nr:DUF86 domain-containing protein [Candidatus Hydrogenedentota bacterium]
MSREWRLYVDDMIQCCKKLIECTSVVSLSDIEDDELRYDGIIRNLEILGEAAKRIPEGVRAFAPEVPWNHWIGMRNILAHAYFGIDKEVVRNVLANEIEPYCIRCFKSDRRTGKLDCVSVNAQTRPFTSVTSSVDGPEVGKKLAISRRTK